MLLPIVEASLKDKLLSTEINKDNICQDGEFPLIHKECNQSFVDVLNGKADYGWLYKIATLAVILLAVYFRRYLLDKDFLIILLIILLVIIVNPYITKSFINENIQDIPKPELNQTNATGTPNLDFQSNIDKDWKWFWSIPEKVSSNPFVGWVFLAVIILFIPFLYNLGQDILEKMLRRK